MPPKRSRQNLFLSLWQQRHRVSDALKPLCREIGGLLKRCRIQLRRIHGRDRLLAVIVLLLWVALLFGNFYARDVSRFEGNLITRKISFTYTGEVDKRFLNTIDDIPKLSFQGRQTQSLILLGKFSSKNPDFNKKLAPLTQLEIQLTTPSSGLVLETADVKQAPITLRKVQISPKTHIAGLSYLAKSNQLKLCLQFSQTDLQSGQTDCENPNNAASNQPAVGSLDFGVTQSPLKLFIENAKIPTLGAEESTLETSLLWTPEGQDFTLPVTSPASLQISLPKADNSSEDKVTEDVTRSIRGDIPVNNVRFANLDRTGSISDDIETSEILDGEVRMMGQSLKLQQGQFLIVPANRTFDKPNCRIPPTQNSGIQRLRDIRLNTKDPQGLQTLFSGESKCLAIGLYQEFPTQSIEPSWLFKYLPQEGINAIYTLLGVLTGVLFPRLFPTKDETKS